jgi:hypothetical protein
MPLLLSEQDKFNASASDGNARWKYRSYPSGGGGGGKSNNTSKLKTEMDSKCMAAHVHDCAYIATGGGRRGKMT